MSYEIKRYLTRNKAVILMIETDEGDKFNMTLGIEKFNSMPAKELDWLILNAIDKRKESAKVTDIDVDGKIDALKKLKKKDK